jgi:hypothetical protein
MSWQSGESLHDIWTEWNEVMVYVSSILTTSTNKLNNNNMKHIQKVNGKEVDMTNIVLLQMEKVLTRQDVLGVIETNKQCI